MTFQRKGFQPHCDSDMKMNTNTVKIANVPNHVNRGEVVALFSTLIGDVRSTSEFRDAIGTHIEITFLSHDAAKKALCMSGYTISGCSLVVTPVFKEDDVSPTVPDNRRNLYVLGIPFDLNKGEFAAVFSRYGKVSHCVILATVDNASRRRGFVVMASHEDAKRAMMALTRTQIKYCFDFFWLREGVNLSNAEDIPLMYRGRSFSVPKVCRSSFSPVQLVSKVIVVGFLDGGDRAMVFDSHSVQESEEAQGNPVFSSVDSSGIIPSAPPEKSFLLTFVPTETLLVTNLPFILFADTSDLEPLLFPFGAIKKLEIITLPSPQETVSALVEYDALDNATDAKESLQGQCYAQYRINAEYVVFPNASPMTPEVPAFSGFDEFEIKPDCNLPRANFCSISDPPSQSRNHSNVLKRPLQDISNSSIHHPFALPSIASFAPKSGGFMTRSSSANSRWSNDSTQCYSRNQYPYPSQMHQMYPMHPSGYKVQSRLVYTPVYN